MFTELGSQYYKDNKFKAKARLHQSKFRAEILKAGFRDYGNRLAEKDAREGKNFYLGFNGLFDEVKRRYPLKYTPLYYDMLRSEHMPFNFFIPFKYLPELGCKILNKFLGGIIGKIGEIKIEYAPKPREKYLNDGTSFDTYITYTHIDGTNGFIGVEVKYTEQEYLYGKREKDEINNPTSTYNRLTKSIGIYRENCLEALKTAKYKQVWRNQLLGESMLELENKFSHFTSVILYPQGNPHFVDVCNGYKKFLKEEFTFKFVGITFEDFIMTGNRYALQDDTKSWLEYLESRYIVSE